MSKEQLGRPFTAEELDKDIAGFELAFRITRRLATLAFENNDRNEHQRQSEGLAQQASILAELRYQRERIS